MAATGTPTPNIGLRIPLGTDPASVDDINYNSTLLDTKLGAVGNDSVQDQLNDLNSNFTVTTGGSGSIRYRKMYRIVFVTVWAATNSTSLSALPNAADYVKCVLFSGSTVGGYIEYVSNTGWTNNIASGQTVYGSFMYITES